MDKVMFSNSFHQTTINLEVPAGELPSEAQVRRAHKALCGHSGMYRGNLDLCGCSTSSLGTARPQTPEAEEIILHLAEAGR